MLMMLRTAGGCRRGIAAVPATAPSDGWGCAGSQRRSAAPRVPHPGSRLAFSHTLALLLYLSLIIRPALRNPRLPPRQLLLIYPPRLRNTRCHRRLPMGRAGDEGRGTPAAPGTCPAASAGLGCGVPGDVAVFLFPRRLAEIAASGESEAEPRQCPQMWSCRN